MKTDTQDATTRTAHTSGPWTASQHPGNGYSITIYDSSCVPMANVSKGLGLDWVGANAYAGGVAEANARLIAAAPDMLSALKAAKTIKEGAALKSTSFKLEALIEIGKLLDAAIAKAGGQ